MEMSIAKMFSSIVKDASRLVSALWSWKAALLRERQANVGDALLRDAESRPSFRTDIRGIGLLMVELMEQKTSALNPNDLKVTNPESWTDHPEILAFLANTDTHSLEELLSHPFIPSVADYNCFATYALLAQLSAYIPTSLV